MGRSPSGFAVITVPAGMESAFRVEVNGFDCVWIIEEGAERQDSVFKALQFAQAKLSLDENTLLAVHDTARCLVSAECVRRVVDSACVWSEGGQSYFEHSLPRHTLWSIQTPQVFRFDLLVRAHQSAAPGATDDASLVARLQRVALVMGDRTNIKITTPDDLPIASFILSENARSLRESYE